MLPYVASNACTLIHVLYYIQLPLVGFEIRYEYCIKYNVMNPRPCSVVGGAEG